MGQEHERSINNDIEDNDDDKEKDIIMLNMGQEHERSINNDNGDDKEDKDIIMLNMGQVHERRTPPAGSKLG